MNRPHLLNKDCQGLDRVALESAQDEIHIAYCPMPDRRRESQWQANVENPGCLSYFLGVRAKGRSYQYLARANALAAIVA